MTRKIITFCIVIGCIFAVGLIAGCSKNEDTNKSSETAEASKPAPSAVPSQTAEGSATTPTFSPDITKTEGQFIDTNPPSMEGPVVALDDETITLKILGREYKLTLSDRAKEEITIYRDKIGTPVQVGSYMQIPYEKTEDGYIAYNLRFVKSN